jgi:putative peptidoglycan lipid II flippase
MLLALGTIAVLCVVFAPTVVHLLAPGFRDPGDRFPLAVEFVRFSVPYIAVAGLVSVAAATLNAEGRVGAAALGLVVFNVVMVAAVAAVLVSGIGATPLAGAILSAAIVAAGICQFLLVGGALSTLPQPPVTPRLTRSAGVGRFFALMVPGVLAGGVPQLKLMAGAMVASSSQAAVSWLYYANRLYELPLGVVSVAIASVLVPVIAASVRAKDRAATASAQSRAFEIAFGLSLPSALAFALLADAIAGGLFERGAFGPRDTAAVAGALAAICAGLPGHTLEKVFGAVSFAHEDTRTPMFAALAGLATALGGSLLLFPTHGHVGIAAAIAISGWVGAAVLGLVLARRRWLIVERDLWRQLVRIAIAATAMAVVLIALKAAIAMTFDLAGSGFARLVSLAVLVASGLFVYLVGLQVLGVARLRDVMASIRQGL